MQVKTIRFRLAVVTCGVIFLAMAGRAAQAKVELRSSDPAAEAVLATSPQELVMTFSEPIQPAYSVVAVINGNGKRIDVGHVERDPAKATVVHVPLFGRAQGTCQVTWHVVGGDKRSVSGHFVFVAP